MAEQQEQKPKKKRGFLPEEPYKRLKDSPYFNEIVQMLKDGKSPERIAEYMQEELNQFLDTKRATLVRQLYRFRGTLKPGEVKIVRTYVERQIEELKRGINEIEETEKLYLYQLKRIGRLGQTEEQMNLALPTVRAEIELAAKLLVQMTDLKIKYGLIQQKNAHDGVSAVSAANSQFMDQWTQGMDEEQKARISRAAAAIVKATLFEMQQNKTVN